MQTTVAQVPEHYGVWSLALFGIGIAALLFAFRRTVSYQRRLRRRPPLSSDERTVKARELIGEIETRDLYAKRQRAIMLSRCDAVSAEQRVQLGRVTKLQARRRSF